MGKSGWMRGSAALLVLLALGCSSAAKPEHLGYIVPGQGIKDLSLSEDRTQVEASWGQPDDVYNNPFDADNVIVAYHQKGVEVSYRGGKVDCVNLYPQKDAWQTYEGATQSGIWVLSPEKEVRRILGSPVSEAPQALNYPGLTVYVSDGKVDYLTVVPLAADDSAGTSAPAATGQTNRGAEQAVTPAGKPEDFNLLQEENPAAESIKNLRSSARKITESTESGK